MDTIIYTVKEIEFCQCINNICTMYLLEKPEIFKESAFSRLKIVTFYGILLVLREIFRILLLN